MNKKRADSLKTNSYSESLHSSKKTVRILHLLTKSEFFKFLDGEIRFLKREGFESLLAAAPGEKHRRMAAEEGGEAFDIPMEREISPFKDGISLLRLIRLFRKTRPVIVNAGTPKAGLLGMIAAWLCRIPVRVYQVRGIRLETARGWKRVLLAATERIACFCAHSVVCNSRSVLEEMIRLRLLAPRKGIVLGNGSSKGVDPDRFTLSRDLILEGAKIRRKYRIASDASVLSFIGRLVADKGIWEIAETYRKLRETNPRLWLLIVGGEEKGSSPIDADTLRFLRSEPQVIFIGELTDVRPVLAASDLFLFPSYREGLPNVVLEAESMGVPVIGFETTGVKDAVLDWNPSLLVPREDPSRLEEKVRWFLSDSEETLQAASAARNFTYTHFLPERVFQAYADHYRSLLKERALTAPLAPKRSAEISPNRLSPEEETRRFTLELLAKEGGMKGGDVRQFSVWSALAEEEKAAVASEIDEIRAELRKSQTAEDG